MASRNVTTTTSKPSGSNSNISGNNASGNSSSTRTSTSTTATGTSSSHGRPSTNSQELRLDPKSSPPLRPPSVALVSGFQARVGMALMLLSLAVVVRFGNSDVVSSILARCLLGEATVQTLFALFTRANTVIFTPYHILLTFVITCMIFFQFPLQRFNMETALVLGAIIAFPFSIHQLWHGVLTTQLGYHLSSSYWMFSFETQTRAGMPASNNFALLYTSPLSVIVVLRATQMMVQLLEIGGLDESERLILSQARNHFLYRVRNSGSLRHKAIATELLFRVIAGLLMRRTAMRMTEPSGPVSTTISFMERQFSKRLIEQSETFIKPLPAPFDPDSASKWILLTVASLLLHKRVFKAVKMYQGGSLDSSMQATKHLSRFSFLFYLTARFAILNTKRSSSDTKTPSSPPRMYN